MRCNTTRMPGKCYDFVAAPGSKSEYFAKNPTVVSPKEYHTWYFNEFFPFDGITNIHGITVFLRGNVKETYKSADFNRKATSHIENSEQRNLEQSTPDVTPSAITLFSVSGLFVPGLTPFSTWRGISPPAGRNRPPCSRNVCTTCKHCVNKLIAYHAAAGASGHSFQSNVRFARPPRKACVLPLQLFLINVLPRCR